MGEHSIHYVKRPVYIYIYIYIYIYMLYSHEQLYIHMCMQNHNDAIKTSGHSSLEKYTSHFIERVVCERELETEQNCNILTPTLLAITAFLSHSPGLLNRGPGGQPLRDMLLTPASSLQLTELPVAGFI